MEKNSSRAAATFGGLLPVPFGIGAAIGADEKKRLQSAAGAFAGNLVGAAIANRTRSRYAAPVLLGGGLGAYLAHGKNTMTKKAQVVMEKIGKRHSTEIAEGGAAGALAGGAAVGGKYLADLHEVKRVFAQPKMINILSSKPRYQKMVKNDAIRHLPYVMGGSLLAGAGIAALVNRKKKEQNDK